MKMNILRKGFAVAIMVGILAMIIACAMIMIALVPLSERVSVNNPTVSFMKIPILVLSEILMLLLIANFSIGEALLIKGILNSIFTHSSVRLLRMISWGFVVEILLVAGIVWYTTIHVSGSITNLYAILLGSAFLVLFLVFRLSAHFVKEATLLKEEVSLTI